jgi:hypothetical protein
MATRMSPFFDYLYIAWPRIVAVKRTFQANMDVPHAIGRPILAAELRSPTRFPGVRPQRNDTVVTVQSRLRGLPYFDALHIENQRRASLNMQAQSPPRAATGTIRNGR